nr:hypothetical protein [Bacillus sp. FJAT-44742]
MELFSDYGCAVPYRRLLSFVFVFVVREKEESLPPSMTFSPAFIIPAPLFLSTGGSLVS